MQHRYEKDILVLPYIAEEGVGQIVKHRFAELQAYFKPAYLRAIAEQKNYDVAYVSAVLQDLYQRHQPLARREFFSGEGAGILALLYNMAKSRHKGLCIQAKEIPIRQSSIEICEYYGINPYRLKTRALLLLCDNGERILQILRREYPELADCAGHIGYLTANKDKIIIDKEEIQYIDKAGKDELYKIIEGDV